MRISKRLVPSTSGKEPLRVVLVDDNPMTVKLAAYVFSDAGWRVDGFTSPLKALEALRTFEPDLIITDFRMPEMSGPQFLLAAEKLHELTPKLVLTAFDDEECVQSVLRKAGVACLSKTLGLTELLARAHELVSVRTSLKKHSAVSFQRSAVTER